jgi:hypothetical protein
MATLPLGSEMSNAVFDRERSDAEPSSTNSRNLIPYDVSATTETSDAAQKLTFLGLPAEIRLEIYDILLVNRWEGPIPSWDLRGHKTGQKRVRLLKALPDPRTISPNILRTCKQIYIEARPIIYTQNLFDIHIPDDMLKFLAQIGPTNIKFVRSLEIGVHWEITVDPWLKLLQKLAEEATGLRSIELQWIVSCYRDEFEHRGLGDSLPFVRALASIKQLEKLKIGGLYAKHWPAYLAREMDVQLHVECGIPDELWWDCDTEAEFKANPEDDAVDMGLVNETNLEYFEMYQEGTENLIP